MDDPSSLITTGQLLAVLILVLANGFFVAAEFSLEGNRVDHVRVLTSTNS